MPSERYQHDPPDQRTTDSWSPDDDDGVEQIGGPIARLLTRVAENQRRGARCAREHGRFGNANVCKARAQRFEALARLALGFPDHPHGAAA